MEPNPTEPNTELEPKEPIPQTPKSTHEQPPNEEPPQEMSTEQPQQEQPSASPEEAKSPTPQDAQSRQESRKSGREERKKERRDKRDKERNDKRPRDREEKKKKDREEKKKKDREEKKKKDREDKKKQDHEDGKKEGETPEPEKVIEPVLSPPEELPMDQESIKGESPEGENEEKKDEEAKTPASLTESEDEKSEEEELARDEGLKDPCLLWIIKKIQENLVKFNAETMWKHEFNGYLTDFINNTTKKKLFFYLNPDYGIQISKDNPPDFYKSGIDPEDYQVVYFIKNKKGVKITLNNISENVICGLIDGDPIDDLLNNMNSTYLPSFLKEENWPDAVKKEFTAQIHKFMATLVESSQKDMTTLYIPNEDLSDIKEAANDKDLLQRLESTLIHWTRQIKDVVVDQNSTQDRENSGPIEEIKHWNRRHHNLELIHKQLEKPQLIRILNVLDQASSSYLTNFKELSKRIKKRTYEAENNIQFLLSLQEPCKKLEESDPKDIPGLLPDILNRVRMIWELSKKYNKPERICGLLNLISNEIIKRCRDKINIEDMLDGDVEKCMKDLDESIHCGEQWKIIVNSTLERIRKYSPRPNLEFGSNSTSIFAQTDAFVQRCKDLKEICEGQLQFARKGSDTTLPEFGGTKGNDIKNNLDQLKDSFKKQLDKIRKLKEEILDVKNTKWHSHYSDFKLATKDLEVMFQNIISLAFNGISTVQEAVDMLENFDQLAKRSSIKEYVHTKAAEMVYELFRQEIKDVESIFETHSILDQSKKQVPMTYSHPKFAGSALWTKSLQSRLKKSKDAIDTLVYIPPLSIQYKALEEYDTLYKNLSGYIQASVFSDWEKEFKKMDQDNLEKYQERNLIVTEEKAESFTLIPTNANHNIFSRHNGLLESNFDKGLLRLLSEVKYWDKLKTTGIINPHIHAIQKQYSEREKLRKLRESVLSVVGHYNEIYSSIDRKERRIFRELLDHLNKKILPGMRTYKWSATENVANSFVKNCLSECSQLYEKVQTFKRNNNNIEKEGKKISETILIEIDKKKIYTLTEFIAHEQVVMNQRKEDFIGSCNFIRTNLNEIYEFFIDAKEEVQGEWLKFIDEKDRQLFKSLKSSVHNTLVEFCRTISGDSKNDPVPIFKIFSESDLKTQMEWTIVNDPTHEELMAAIQKLIGDINGVTKVVPRIEKEFMKDREKMLLEKAKREQEKKASNRRDLQKQETQMVALDSNDKEDLRRGLPEGYRLVEKEEFFSEIAGSTEVKERSKLITQAVESIKDKLDAVIKEWQNSKFKELFRYRTEKGMKRLVHDNQRTFDSNPASRYTQSIDTVTNLCRKACEIIMTKNEKFVQIDPSKLKQKLREFEDSYQVDLLKMLHEESRSELYNLLRMIDETAIQLKTPPKSLKMFEINRDLLVQTETNLEKTEQKIKPIEDRYNTLHSNEYSYSEDEANKLANLKAKWEEFKNVDLEAARKTISTHHRQMKQDIERSLDDFDKEIADIKKMFDKNAPKSTTTKIETSKAKATINEYIDIVKNCRKREAELKIGMDIFEIEHRHYQDLSNMEKELTYLNEIWNLKEKWDNYWNQRKVVPFREIQIEEITDTIEGFLVELKGLEKKVKDWPVYDSIKKNLDQSKDLMPIIESLQAEAMKARHWDKLKKELKEDFEQDSEDFTLHRLANMKLFQYAEIIDQLTEEAMKDLALENELKKIKANWSVLNFAIEGEKDSKKADKTLFKISVNACEVIFQTLEEDVARLSAMKSSSSFLAFADKVEKWENNLALVSDTIELLIQVQKQWSYLGNILHEDTPLSRQVAEEKNKFSVVNRDFTELIAKLKEQPNVLQSCTKKNFFDTLVRLNEILETIQKALNQNLFKVRTEFPRFYFLSNEDLLEIIAKSTTPSDISRHLKKCFEGIYDLGVGTVSNTKGIKQFEINDIKSIEGEEVKLQGTVQVGEQIEIWMKHLEEKMKEALKKIIVTVKAKRDEVKQDISKLPSWVRDHPGQLLITVSQLLWTEETETVLKNLHSSNNPFSKSFWTPVLTLQRKFIQKLINDVRISKSPSSNLEPLSKVNRMKYIALITIEVHNRDVREELEQAKIMSENDFEWQKQLRFTNENAETPDTYLVKAHQTHSSIEYGFEYQGNNGRLVVTPLTDRCYLTLTTALNLKRGAAPQGPAGTGKTETVKDLGKNLAKFVLVFNCSDSLDEKSLGRMISGLAQTGAWGCFDEFNRIDVEVLSVVSLYISIVLDAVRAGKEEFIFETNRKLNKQVGIFITMNPDYTGRTQLPDNLKSLFRPVSMMVPDFELIGENILMAEGFSSGTGKANVKEVETHKDLARKVVTIYKTMQQQLSKQDHYDFGMRALKSVLTFAGNLRRERSDLPETVILMQAIHDMNMPKLVSEDIPLFVNLLRDLFPKTDLPEPENDELIEAIEDEMNENKFQLNPILAEKTLQLFDSKNTRHGNMLVGDTWSGKTSCWKILQGALNRLKKKGKKFIGVKTYIINPKSISIDELFGSYNLANEWNDGILTTELKNACNGGKTEDKWLILDGPVDTLWIESMNSLLDDNKILTLITGDRIALNENVGLLFEVENLSMASPATVSRCGMIYLDAADLGWKPYIDSWISKKVDEETRTNLESLVDKYIPRVLKTKRAACKDIIKVSEISTVASLTHLFDSIMSFKQKNVAEDEENENSENYWGVFEKVFVYSLLWSIGGVVEEKCRREIDLIIRDIDSIFPIGSLYDFGVDIQKGDWFLFEEKLQDTWKVQDGADYHSIQVSTVDTLRTLELLEKLYQCKRHILLVGSTGVGKTALVQTLLKKLLDETVYYHFSLIFSAQTSSNKTQEIIESHFERRGKNKLLPPLGKKALVFVDDLNMPRKDQYGSQPPLELLRQWMDYGGWYDRGKKSFKYIVNMQMISAMGPPGGGRADITQRLLSEYHVINFAMPSQKQITRIFTKIAEAKLQYFDDEEIKSLSEPLASATYSLFMRVSEDFKPTPTKSHYLFNMRDISKVFQGIHRADKDYYSSRESMIKLWAHEVLRIFQDRLVNNTDKDQFNEIMKEQLDFFGINPDQIKGKHGGDPIFVDFLTEDAPIYREAVSLEKLKSFLDGKLKDYNSEPRTIPMNLVLFEDAMLHLCRIYRIFKLSRGNALLVGVGGSGRHSLSRLGAYIGGMKMEQLEITRAFNVNSFREYLKGLFFTLGIKKREAVFIFSDNDIIDESFIEDINNILSSGEVPNMYTADELQNIREELKKEMLKVGAANAGMKEDQIENIEECYDFFISRVRDNLHIVLCMSPIGSSLRNYCRMYPGIVNNTMIDWFQKWPETALEEVALKFVRDMEFSEEICQSLSSVFSFMHTSVEKSAQQMIDEIKRIFYVTPTNYIELMKLYSKILADKRKEIGDQIDKLKNGLKKLEEAQVQVQQMTQDSESKKTEKTKKHKTCEELMLKIQQESAIADEKQERIMEEKAKIDEERSECDLQLHLAEQELAKAEPALQAAAKALDSLDKKTLGELKSYSKPPEDVERVMVAVMIIFEKPPVWGEVKKFLANPNLLQMIKEFKPEDKLNKKIVGQLEKYTREERFKPDFVKQKSEAASILCQWVRSVEDYYKAFETVKPKKAKRDATLYLLKKKEEDLNSKTAEFEEITARIKELKDQFKVVNDEMTEFARAVEELQSKIERGETLIGDLSSEKNRWDRQILVYNDEYKKLIGDCLVSAAFMSYCGPFTSEYRENLNKQWINKVNGLEIQMSRDYEFTKFMVGISEVQNWILEGLPTDKFSAQNGVMITKSIRWPLLIDPQNQGKLWINNHENKDGGKKERKLEQANKKLRSNYLAVVKRSIKYGKACIIPDIGEEIDPDLEPVLNKSIKKQVDRYLIKVGKDEVDYNPKFRLYITTNLANPHYTPEITTKVTLINFQVKEQGLEEQLLDKVFAKLEADQESAKSHLVISIGENQKKVIELEDKILRLLKESKVALLDDIELIEALKTSKLKADEVKQQLELAEQQRKRIELSRDKYRECAKKASILYFVLDDLARIDPMYQFSLEWYMNLFEKSIVDCSEAMVGFDTVEEQVHTILTHHKLEVYQKACRSLFEKHKLLLALQMVVKLVLTEKDMEEWNFFLRGGVVLERIDQPKNPAADWISQRAWDNITELDKLMAFGGLVGGLTYNTKEWKKWYLQQRPENEALPGEWETKCEDALKKMLVLRCLRPDRIILKASKFVEDKLGAKYVDNKPVSLKDVYKDSNNKTPIILVLSPGVDPLEQLQNLANTTLPKTQEFVPISLGQGQSMRARTTLKDATEKGNWVYFANCHLALSWLPELESIVESLGKQSNLSESFRLFLSSNPHPKFPLGILQKSLKVTTEPPKGIKANMIRLYNNIKEKSFEKVKEMNAFSKTIFGLAWFHSILVERKKFKTLGWNVLYDFNDSDFSACEDLIFTYKKDEVSQMKWSSLQPLIADTNYGGRITDDFDRKLIKIYASEIFNEKQLSALGSKATGKKEEEESKLYSYPDLAGKNADSEEFKNRFNNALFLEHIQKAYPSYDLPIVFGQHVNAEIASQQADATLLLQSFMVLQTKVIASTTEEEEEEEGATEEKKKNEKEEAEEDDSTTKVIQNLLEMIPENFDFDEIRIKWKSEENQARARNEDISALTVVLFQEIHRYNVLLTRVRNSLISVQQCMKGLVVISPEIEEITQSINANQVPAYWQFAYASLKPLGFWISDLKERCKFFNTWAYKGFPVIYNISAFTYPTGFTTALFQKYARKLEYSIDSLYMDYLFPNEKNISDKAKDGAYVKGLYLEGAKWNKDDNSLMEPETMRLNEPMPLIHFKPALTGKKEKSKKEGGKKDASLFYYCPCYYYPVRQAINGRESYMFTLYLKTGSVPPEFWTKRGTALLMSLAE